MVCLGTAVCVTTAPHVMSWVRAVLGLRGAQGPSCSEGIVWGVGFIQDLRLEGALAGTLAGGEALCRGTACLGGSTCAAAPAAGGHGVFCESGGKAVSAKQSIFIHLYLLNGKKNLTVKIKLYIFPHPALCFLLWRFCGIVWRPKAR